jgi:hypothetical protein
MTENQSPRSVGVVETQRGKRYYDRLVQSWTKHNFVCLLKNV